MQVKRFVKMHTVICHIVPVGTKPHLKPVLLAFLAVLTRVDVVLMEIQFRAGNKAPFFVLQDAMHVRCTSPQRLF